MARIRIRALSAEVRATRARGAGRMRTPWSPMYCCARWKPLSERMEGGSRKCPKNLAGFLIAHRKISLRVGLPRAHAERVNYARPNSTPTPPPPLLRHTVWTSRAPVTDPPGLAAGAPALKPRSTCALAWRGSPRARATPAARPLCTTRQRVGGEARPRMSIGARLRN